MTLYIAAFPSLGSDSQWIYDFREHHDPLAKLVRPHITLVFPTSSFSEEVFRNEISRAAHDFSRLRVSLRSALLMPEASQTGMARIFLVPDEGFGSIVRLHDGLYSQGLKSAHRLDVPFIPHMTIGAGIELRQAKILVDRLNSQNFEVEFELSELSIVMIKDPKAERKILATLPLRQP